MNENNRDVESVPVKQVGDVVTSGTEWGTVSVFKKPATRTEVNSLLGPRESKWKKGTAIPTEATTTTARRLWGRRPFKQDENRREDSRVEAVIAPAAIAAWRAPTEKKQRSWGATMDKG